MLEWIGIYWQLLFSMEYFPMFEFYTLGMLTYFILISMKLSNIENQIKEI